MTDTIISDSTIRAITVYNPDDRLSLIVARVVATQELGDQQCWEFTGYERINDSKVEVRFQLL